MQKSKVLGTTAILWGFAHNTTKVTTKHTIPRGAPLVSDTALHPILSITWRYLHENYVAPHAPQLSPPSSR